MIDFSTPVHKTNIIPLRWFANKCNYISSYFLKNAVYFDYLDEEHDIKLGFKYKFNIFMYNFVDKPYKRWGTYYKVDIDKWKEHLQNDPVLDILGSDYDEDGIPYWDK